LSSLLVKTEPCGLLGWSLFCPFQCGFFKRLFRIGNCSNDKNDPASILTTFVNRIELSNRTISKNGKTPEDKALKYLIVNDTTFNISQLSTLSSVTPNVVQFRISQRYALLTLFFQQTVVSQWYDTTGWLVNANECNSWFGISCASFNVEGTRGVQNVVTGVNLYNNNMKGTIPADVGLLTALTSFNVYNNVAITGTLPTSMGQWTALTYFNVQNNALTGTLPASIGQWTALIYFGAGNNELTGTLPASIGQWTALTYINAYYNELTGTLPASIGQWTALTYFGFYNNALTGTIPASIVNWSKINTAFFDGNQFTGSIPNGICPYITGNDRLDADCVSKITCGCCTTCF
jgi:Leucine-rich repeat (LRR) protein